MVGKGSPEDTERGGAGQTYQLFEEGSFLVLLRIALILVQAILQLQCECVIVGSYYLQHLGRSRARQGLVQANPRLHGPMHAPPAALLHCSVLNTPPPPKKSP